MLNLKGCDALRDGEQVVGIILLFEKTHSSYMFFSRFINNFAHGCIAVDGQNMIIRERTDAGLINSKEFDLSSYLGLQDLEVLSRLIQGRYIVWNCDQSGDKAKLTGRSLAVI